MRKIVNVLVLTVVIIAAYSSIVFAARTEYVEGKRVYDYADLFTYDEEESLEELAESMEIKTETEFYVLTIDDAEGKSAMEYADDFGDNGRFGYEEEYGTYVVMLIDMDNREVWISTSGRAIEYLNDSRIDKTLDDMFAYIPDGRYYKAAEAYLKTAGRYMLSDPSEDYKNDDYNYDDTYDDTYYYDDGHYYEDETGGGELVLGAFFISAIISAVVLVIMIVGAKTKMTAGGSDYIGRGGLMINHRDDIFTHTTTVKRKIETDSGSRSGGGGGSSVHRSSGGHSHGGGGRRF